MTNVVKIGEHNYKFLFLVSDARRLKAAGIDIFDAKKYEMLFSNLMSQFDLISEFCLPQIQANNTSVEDFLDCLVKEDGKFSEAMEAMVSGLENFFRNVGQNAMQTVVKRSRELAMLVEEKKTKKLLDPKVQIAIEKELERKEREIDINLARVASGEISLLAQQSSE